MFAHDISSTQNCEESDEEHSEDSNLVNETNYCCKVNDYYIDNGDVNGQDEDNSPIELNNELDNEEWVWDDSEAKNKIKAILNDKYLLQRKRIHQDSKIQMDETRPMLETNSKTKSNKIAHNFNRETQIINWTNQRWIS